MPFLTADVASALQPLASDRFRNVLRSFLLSLREKTQASYAGLQRQLAAASSRAGQRDRAELAGWKLYGGPVRAGVEMFWSVFEQGQVSVLGLPLADDRTTTVVETYPRYVIKRLWPDQKIPSKAKEPLTYIDVIAGRILASQYTHLEAVRTHDQVDAMLCALAAEACLVANGLPDGRVGTKPFVDEKEKLLREGFIVSP